MSVNRSDRDGRTLGAPQRQHLGITQPLVKLRIMNPAQIATMTMTDGMIASKRGSMDFSSPPRVGGALGQAYRRALVPPIGRFPLSSWLAMMLLFRADVSTNATGKFW